MSEEEDGGEQRRRHRRLSEPEACSCVFHESAILLDEPPQQPTVDWDAFDDEDRFQDSADVATELLWPIGALVEVDEPAPLRRPSTLPCAPLAPPPPPSPPPEDPRPSPSTSPSPPPSPSSPRRGSFSRLNIVNSLTRKLIKRNPRNSGNAGVSPTKKALAPLSKKIQPMRNPQPRKTATTKRRSASVPPALELCAPPTVEVPAPPSVVPIELPPARLDRPHEAETSSCGDVGCSGVSTEGGLSDEGDEDKPRRRVRSIFGGSSTSEDFARPLSPTYDQIMSNHDKATKSATPRTALTLWLAERNLAQYEARLTDMGVRKLRDLAYLTDEDLLHMDVHPSQWSYFQVHVVS